MAYPLYSTNYYSWYLLAKGADVNVSARGATALMAASQEGHNEIVQLLKKAGAKK